jgi:acyl dehydratase
VTARAPHEIVVGPITVTDIVRFAGASGDFNRLHHDDAYARDAGFPSIFAMGQMQAGILSRLVMARFGPHGVLSYRVRFTAKVWPGDVLTLRITKEESRPRTDGEVIVECCLEGVRQNGEIAVQAWATGREQ